MLILTRGGGPLGALNPLRVFAHARGPHLCLRICLCLRVQRRRALSFPCFAEESDPARNCFLLAALPTLFMRATRTAVVAASERIALDLDSSIIQLYTANLLGAVLGAAGGALLLIPTFGLSLSLGFSGGLNIVSGVTAMVLSFVSAKLICPRNPVEIAASKAPDTVVPQIDCALVFLSAAATLAMEVTMTRLFTLVVGSSTYSVATVLVGSLLGIYLVVPDGQY